MRIGRQTTAWREFLPKILQMRFVQTAFEIRARIHSRRGVTLKINHVAGEIFRAPTEKMILRDFVKCRRRREGRDVTTDVRVRIRLHHHRHRVPADDALDATFNVAVARIHRLVGGRNRVDVRRVLPRDRTRLGAQLAREFFEQFRRAFRPATFQREFQNGLQRFVQLVAVGGR